MSQYSRDRLEDDAADGERERSWGGAVFRRFTSLPSPPHTLHTHTHTHTHTNTNARAHTVTLDPQLLLLPLSARQNPCHLSISPSFPHPLLSLSLSLSPSLPLFRPPLPDAFYPFFSIFFNLVKTRFPKWPQHSSIPSVLYLYTSPSAPAFHKILLSLFEIRDENWMGKGEERMYCIELKRSSLWTSMSLGALPPPRSV